MHVLVAKYFDGTMWWRPSCFPKSSWEATAPTPSLCALSLGYIKGQCRVATLLALVLLASKTCQGPLMEVLPELMKTAGVVHVTREAVSSKVDQLLQNTKLSFRGSIRKAPSIITWVAQLRGIQADVANVIGQWNRIAASKDQRLVGQKATSVSNVMAFPSVAVDILIGMVSQFGWELIVLDHAIKVAIAIVITKTMIT